MKTQVQHLGKTQLNIDACCRYRNPNTERQPSFDMRWENKNTIEYKHTLLIQKTQIQKQVATTENALHIQKTQPKTEYKNSLQMQKTQLNTEDATKFRYVLKTQKTHENTLLLQKTQPNTKTHSNTKHVANTDNITNCKKHN